VGTLRTLRELLFQTRRDRAYLLRAWDTALWSGVTPQGAIKSMDRIERCGLVRRLPSGRRGRADAFRLVPAHPLVPPLVGLFEAERLMAPLPRRGRYARGPAGRLSR